MVKHWLVVAAAISWSVPFARTGIATAFADEVESSDGGMAMEASAFVGAFFPNAEQTNLGNQTPSWRLVDGRSLEFGGRFAVMPARFGHVELGVEGEVAVVSDELDFSGVELLAYRIQGAARYSLQRRFDVPVTAMGVVGVGGLGRLSTDDRFGEGTYALAHAGLAASYAVNDSIAVRLDLRVMTNLGQVETIRRYPYELLIGPSWRIGGGASSTREDEARKAQQMDPDADGIPNATDQCPEQAETANGYQDEDGCPDQLPDTDGDGIAGSEDRCPDQTEDVDGFEDNDGCPDADNDQDGLLDAEDACPVVAGVAANRGCPDLDQDSDGVVDRLDNCPSEAGTAENQGCTTAQLVVLGDTELQLSQTLAFRTKSGQMRRRSRAVLDNVARVLQQHPEITRVKIVRNLKTTREDQALAQQRVDAVVAHLVSQGVAAERLEAAVSQPEQETGAPIAPTADNEMTFTIVDRSIPAP